MARPFLTADWHHLILANYACDPALLKPHIPVGTELDLWQNQCFVSLVGFQFMNTRVKGIKIPFHVNFEEINLRFYVKYNHEGEWRRGVVFIKEIVPKAAITFVANTVYKEHYVTCDTEQEIRRDNDQLFVRYGWKKSGQTWGLEVDASLEKEPLTEGSEEEFIAEHYWGYTRQSASKSSQYEVRHPSWATHPVKRFAITGDMSTFYGPEFGPILHEEPSSVFLADGSEIEVHPGKVIRS